MQINYGEIFENSFDGNQIKFVGANKVKGDLYLKFEYIKSETKRGAILFLEQVWDRMKLFNNWKKVC